MEFLEILNQVEQRISDIISNKGYDKVNFVVEPSKKGFGDITCNIGFLLAKKLNKKPQEIAEEFVNEFNSNLDDNIQKVESHQSGYLNFFINITSLAESVLPNSQNDNYGDINIGNNKTIVVEHTSVNPNKALHIGHLRNVIIGDSMSRILEKANYNVKVLNYVDDSGLQVADIIVGFKFAGHSETPPSGQKFAHYCGDTVYVKTTQKYEEDKELESKRNDILKELEDKDSEISKFGQKITRNVLADQLKTVWNLGVSYDCLNFESQIIYSKLWDNIFEKMKSQKLVRLETDGDNSGCWVMSVDGEDDKILVRSNGVATYVAKDIPYAAWKLGLLDDPFNYKKYGTQENGRTIYETTLEQSDEEKQSLTSDKVITVIDNRQKRLQNIVSKLMTKFSSDSTYVHLGYEAVTLSQNTVEQLGFATDGKDVQMSGRKGIYINADEIIEKLEDRILRESKKRNQNLTDSELQKISHDVAIGTIRYEMIKPDLDKIISFDINTSLKIEGDTCSYIQYSYARASRILEKSKTKPDFSTSISNIKTEHEINLIKKIGMFQIQVKDSANNHSPKVIARYCYSLAVTFSSFYEHVQVLNSESPELLNSRLCLVLSFQNTLKKALDLLGIVAPERM